MVNLINKEICIFATTWLFSYNYFMTYNHITQELQNQKQISNIMLLSIN